MKKIIREQSPLGQPKASGTTNQQTTQSPNRQVNVPKFASKTNPNQSQGQPNFIGKTVNLYKDPQNKEFLTRLVIKSMSLGMDNDPMFKTNGPDLYYKCQGQYLYYVHYGTSKRTYSTNFVNDLNKTFCAKNKSGVNVPKADYVSAGAAKPTGMAEGKKVIRLTESDLLRLVKKVLKEAAPEPVKTDRAIAVYDFGFPEGKAVPDKVFGRSGVNVNNVLRDLTNKIRESGIVPVLQKYYNTGWHYEKDMKIPKFIELSVGTSHTGGGKTNASVAEDRLNFLEGLITKAFNSFGIDSSVIKSLIVRNSDPDYTPSSLDKNFYDPKKIKPKDYERYGTLLVHELLDRGLTTTGIQNVQKGLNRGSSLINTWVIDGVDEDEVVKNIKYLQSFSDVKDLSNSISAGGKWDGLEDFLNDQLFDDPAEMSEIAYHLQELAKLSGKQKDTIRIVKDPVGYSRISIGLGR